MKQHFRGKIQDFRAIFKKMTPKSPKNEPFFQMAKKTGLDFLNAFCVLWAKGIHPNWWKITETLIHKTKKMKYDPHFWPNMHQNWWNLSKMGWLTLAHGLWWVPLPKIVKTDPKNEIRVRRNSGKVIVLPKLTPKRPILALKWYIWSFWEKWAGSRLLMDCDEFCCHKKSKQIPRMKFGCGKT